jgi:MoaA/NifB/PqqE/SkfB family radical SAM enzyme
MTETYVRKFDESVRDLFGSALRMGMENPSWLGFLLKTYCAQRSSLAKRVQNEKNGVHVPPLLIMSVTQRCNLACSGCYAKVAHGADSASLSQNEMERIVGEAEDLGVSIVFIAGGEPLMRPDILDIAASHPKITFPMFTNGILIPAHLSAIVKAKNLIPIISVEGFEDKTDARRGEGVFEKVTQSMNFLKSARKIFGVSVTVTSENLDEVTSSEFVRKMMDMGARVFFYVEYVPLQAGTEHLCPTNEQRKILAEKTAKLQKTLPAIFVAFPGDEEKYGGCLSSGRGFVHVAANGSLEPCPFAPFSAGNLKEMSLKEALKSRFLEELRNNHDKLTETSGGCALWKHRDWARNLQLTLVSEAQQLASIAPPVPVAVKVRV